MDDNLLASASEDKTVKIWNITEGIRTQSFDSQNGGHSAWVRCLAYLGNGILASGSGDGKIQFLLIKKRFNW